MENHQIEIIPQNIPVLRVQDEAGNIHLIQVRAIGEAVNTQTLSYTAPTIPAQNPNGYKLIHLILICSAIGAFLLLAIAIILVAARPQVRPVILQESPDKPSCIAFC